MPASPTIWSGALPSRRSEDRTHSRLGITSTGGSLCDGFDINQAIARESEIKQMARQRKTTLIELVSRGWRDLSIE
jgi:hypothetical protein